MKLSDFNGNKKNKMFDNILGRTENQKVKRGKKKEKEEEIVLTDSEMERIMAKLRESRAKERYGSGPGGEHGYEDVNDEITDPEIDYYKQMFCIRRLSRDIKT